jgi:hypothetical protein
VVLAEENMLVVELVPAKGPHILQQNAQHDHVSKIIKSSDI